MSSRIESLAERVAVEWCKVRWESDSDLSVAMNALLSEFDRPAANLEIEKTAKRMANAKSAQSADEKTAEASVANVTAADLAEALREIVRSPWCKADVTTAKVILARFDAQQVHQPQTE